MDTNLGEVILVEDINPGVSGDSFQRDSPYLYELAISSNPKDLVEFKDKLYFKAYDWVNGNELFVSDGTAEGTKLVKDINTVTGDYSYRYSSYPLDFVEFNDKLYFSASGNDEEIGNELYVTDGTAEGTELVADIYPGKDDLFANSSSPGNFVEFNGKLYFSASNEENGTEIYVSDGTSEGTELLIDLNPGKMGDGAKSSYLDNFIEFNDKLYFTANTDEADDGLYVSDGTAKGTELLVDLNSEGIVEADNFVEFDGKLYFSASTGENGNVLYVSDGTAKGTELLVDINPGMEESYGRGNGLYGRELVEFNDKLYFRASNGKNGAELYVSDGTAAGTKLVADIYPGEDSYGDSYSSDPRDLTVFNDKLYFSADNGKNGNELYVSDGTAAGTKLVADIYPGLGYKGALNSSAPSDLTVLGDELFFAANNAETGRELFKLTLGSEGEEILSGCSGDDLAGF